MKLKKLTMILLTTYTVITYGCNHDDGPDPGLLLWEVGASCNGNYFTSACSNDRTSIVECTSSTDGIVTVSRYAISEKELTCDEGKQCFTLLLDNADFSTSKHLNLSGISHECFGSDDKCDKPGLLMKCHIDYIQPEIADVEYCMPADDGNNYIWTPSADLRYCSDLCSEDSCEEKACNQGDAGSCSDDKRVAYNCIANDYAYLHDGPEYVISAQKCSTIAPCQINSQGIAECGGE